MLRILVIRHGQTDYNKKRILQGHINSQLNSEGIAEAALLGQYLANLNTEVDAVWSSDLQRCTLTADTILAQFMPPLDDKSLDVKKTYSKEVRERGLGELEGMHIDDASALVRKNGKAFSDYGEVSSRHVE